MSTLNRPKLTQDFANKATTAKSKDRFPDHKVRGLNLRVMKSGVKTWVILYRKPDRSSAEMKIGSADTMTLTMARGEARKRLSEISAGVDPLEAKKLHVTEAQGRKARTLSAIVGRYRASSKYTHRRPTTRATYDNSLDNHIIPVLGSRPIETLRRSELSAFLDELMDTKSASVSNHAKSALSVIMSFALERDVIDVNPMISVKAKQKTVVRDRILDEAELATLWEALDIGECVTPMVAKMLRIFMLLPGRASEIAGMRWEELNIEERLWTVKGDRMKGHETHELPFGEYIANILRDLKKTSVTPWVFPNLAGDGHMKRDVPTKACARIVSKLEMQKFSPHDLRRTIATGMAKKGIGRDVIERVLSHNVGAGRAIIHYDHHDYREPKRLAIEAWEKELLRIVEGRAVVSNVRSIGRAP